MTLTNKLKQYIKERKHFLQEVLDADISEDSLSVAGQLHELKVLENWIEENTGKDNDDKN